MSEPQLMTETLDEVLDNVIFADPDPKVQRLKAEWERERDEMRLRFEQVCGECLEERLKYHQNCQTPNAEKVAKAEAEELRQLISEERDQSLADVWKGILKRVDAVLEDRRDVD